MNAKENSRLSGTGLKKRVSAKPARMPVQPMLDGSLLFERIHLKSFRQIRGTIAKCLKALVNGQITPEVSRAANAWIDQALQTNHAYILQRRLERIGEFLEMPPDDAGEDAVEPDLPGEELEPDAPEED